MNKEQENECSQPKTNKLFILLTLLVITEFIFVNHIKESTDKEYTILFNLRSLNIIYQKIDSIFEKKNSHQSFDAIVKQTKEFDKTLKLLDTDIHLDAKDQHTNFHYLYNKIKKDHLLSKSHVERYKSWNSLAINSTRLLYDLHEHIKNIIIENKLGQQERPALQLLDEITSIIALVNYDGPSNLQTLRTKMKAFKNISSSYPDLLKALKQQYKHIEVVLESYQLMQTLKTQNKELEIANTIDQLYALLLDELKQQDKESDLNFYILNLFIIFFLIMIMLSSKKSARLHYEVCNLNLKLEDNIETLQNINTDMSELIDKFDHNVIASKTDAKGIITYASYAFCKISGYSKEELLGKPHNIVRHADMPEATYKDMWTSIKAGKIWKGEVKNRAKDGQFYWVDIVISPEFDKDGALSGYSAIRHDITAKKELERLSQSLEDQVRNRTKELEKMMEKVELLSITDELTQLYNRRHYAKIFDAELRSTMRNKKFFNYILLDIDHFKLYNDAYGHQFGDYALQEVAKVFTSILNRPNDFIFRMGGEEFVIIFASSNKDKAINFAQKIIDAVASLKIEHTQNTPYNVLTISGGLVSYPPDTMDISENKTYKKADELLYLAKTEGRNCIKY